MKKILGIAALMGVAGAANVADAAPVAATLVSVITYSNNGSGLFNRTLDTSTWTFDSAAPAAAAVQTGGTYSALAKAGPSPLFRTTMTGVTLGSGAATGATWACLEGNFGTNVGASICGNYNFGANVTNQSTYTPTTTGATVTLGGDDGSLPGGPQTLTSSFTGMSTSSLGGNQFKLSNATFATCLNTASVDPCGGYDFVFQLAGAADTVPDAFAFTDLTNQPVNTLVESDVITVAGINVPTTIVVVPGASGGEYSVNGGAFTNVDGTVSNGDTVKVRQTSSLDPATATSIGLSIGGIADAWSVTTEAADTSPDAFTLTPQTDVQLATQVTSNDITVGGINTPVEISVVGGEYSIDDGSFTSAAGTVSAGQTVAVRQTSSASFDTTTTATLTIGGVPGDFVVTTLSNPDDEVIVIDGGSSGVDPLSLGFLAGLPLLRRRRKAALKLAAAVATVAAAVSVLAGPTQAAEDDRWDWNYDGLYLGAGVNGTSLESDLDIDLVQGSFEDFPVGGQVYAGWMFNRYLGLEGRWSGTDDGESNILLEDSLGARSKVGEAKISLDGWTAYVVGNWPVAQRWDLYGKAGWTWQNADVKFDVDSDFSDVLSSESDDTNDNGVAGALGVRYRFARHWAATLEGEYFGIDFDNALDDPWRTSLNIEYWFGGHEIAPPPPPPAKVVAAPPPPPPPVCEDGDADGVCGTTDQCPDTPKGDRVGSAGCSCDVTRQLQFAFDSAKLTDADKLVLDEMAEKLNRLNFVSGTIAGYTDSIGTDAYNKGLSERRAKTVADYLEAKGIAAGRMQVEGMGEADPIADNKTAEGRAQNRRVVAKRTDCDK